MKSAPAAVRRRYEGCVHCRRRACRRRRAPRPERGHRNRVCASASGGMSEAASRRQDRLASPRSPWRFRCREARGSCPPSRRPAERRRARGRRCGRRDGRTARRCGSRRWWAPARRFPPWPPRPPSRRAVLPMKPRLLRRLGAGASSGLWLLGSNIVSDTGESVGSLGPIARRDQR